MKRTFIIRNIIIGIIVIAVVAGLAFYWINESGKKYEIAEIKQYNYFVLKKENLFGVMDRTGNIIIDPQYDEVKIPNPEKAIFVCKQGDTSKVLNERKEEILTDYQNVEVIQLQGITSDLMYEKSVLKYEEEGKFGLIDFEGKKITKPIYDSIEGLPYKEGELLVKQEEKYGVINIKGKKLVDIAYDQIAVDGYYASGEGYQYAGYVVANTTQEGYRYGYISYQGKEILQTQYNQLNRITGIQDNENAYLICAKNGQVGLMKNEEEVIPNEYQSIEYDEANQLLVVEKSKKYGIANLEGKIIVPTNYNQIDITGVHLYAQNDQGTIVYNSDGSEANIDRNISILNTGNEKYQIRINNENGTKYGVIGKNGEQLIEEKYDYLEYLYEDYFIASTDNAKLGVVDHRDRVKVEINHDSLQKIEGMEMIQAGIASENKTRLYGKDMTMLCEMNNATVTVENEYVKISNGDETRYFDREGKELKNTEVYPTHTLFAKKENDKWGFADKNGQMVVEAKYDQVTEFNEYGFAAVQLDGKWGAVNSKGEEVISPTYTLQVTPSFIGQYYQVRYGFGEVYYTDENE